MNDNQTDVTQDDNGHIDSDALDNDLLNNSAMDGLPDGDRQLVTDSSAIDEGSANDSDLGADVAGDIGPKHR